MKIKLSKLFTFQMLGFPSKYELYGNSVIVISDIKDQSCAVVWMAKVKDYYYFVLRIAPKNSINFTGS